MDTGNFTEAPFKYYRKSPELMGEVRPFGKVVFALHTGQLRLLNVESFVGYVVFFWGLLSNPTH